MRSDPEKPSVFLAKDSMFTSSVIVSSRSKILSIPYGVCVSVTVLIRGQGTHRVVLSRPVDRQAIGAEDDVEQHHQDRMAYWSHQ